ncbi:MAG: HEAT repeat domain-containing protein [Bryobacteraceae bacterium]|jgi:HEAT repeat protein
MRLYLVACALLVPLAMGRAQSVRPKDVRDIAKNGSSAIPRLAGLLKDPAKDVRVEVVKQLTAIGSQASLDPLIQATEDNDPEVQARAADGLVNFYYPGYVQSGLAGLWKRASSSVTGRFGDNDADVVDAYVVARPDVIAALSKLATGGGSMDARAGAARALGVLRGRAALSGLVEAAHSKDSDVIYESLVAIQKIRDPSAGPQVEFRLRDLNQRVQLAAIETVGLLLDKGALPVLTDVLARTGNAKVRRAALTAIAMLPDEASRPLYAKYLHDKDDDMRAAAAEGFGRLRNPQDLPMLEQAWNDEGRPSPRLSLAFALAMDGKMELAQLSPLRYLIDNLNSSAHNGEAEPLLVELARSEQVRDKLYAALPAATKGEKIGLAGVLGRSGDQKSVPDLQKLSADKDPDVAREGLRSLRALQARL